MMQTDCQHVTMRLVSKEGDAPEWVQESAFKPFDTDRQRCELCGWITLSQYAAYLVN